MVISQAVAFPVVSADIGTGGGRSREKVSENGKHTEGKGKEIIGREGSIRRRKKKKQRQVEKC